MPVTFNYPSLTGDTESVRRFLYNLVERLNVAFGSLDDEAARAAGKAVRDSLSLSPSNKATSELQSEYAAIRSLIIKSADYAKTELERIEQQLTSSTVAQSEFGDYRQDVDATITAQADLITQAISYYEQLQSDVTSFSQYATRTEGYISSGIVDYNGSVPIFGVAIGQSLKKGTVTVDGEEYTQILPSDFRTVITAYELSFWRDEVKVAYMSSNSDRLYIPNVEITDKLVIGSWVVTKNSGLTLRWTGG